MKVTLKDLSIRQLNSPSSLLCVCHQHALIVLPVIIKQVKISIVEARWWWDGNGIIIVDLPVTVEFIMSPISLISQLSTFIEEFAPSMHLIIFPLPIIVASILIKELAPPISDIILFISFILASCFILLDNKFHLLRRLVLWIFWIIRCFFIDLYNCRIIFIWMSLMRWRCDFNGWWWFWFYLLDYLLFWLFVLNFIMKYYCIVLWLVHQELFLLNILHFLLLCHLVRVWKYVLILYWCLQTFTLVCGYQWWVSKRLSCIILYRSLLQNLLPFLIFYGPL